MELDGGEGEWGQEEWQVSEFAGWDSLLGLGVYDGRGDDCEGRGV